MKKLIALLSMLFISLSIFAGTGAMAGQKNLRVSTTRWFDIVYPEACSKSAQILYENADSLYDQIAENYGHAAIFRMPVVITPAVESFNAYWTAAPYNHIVIYDTYPVEDLEVFSETLLMTFKHELTHAYTYNLKNKFWKTVADIFGDSVSPGYIFITRGWAEGATLTSESIDGEGRLNSGYANQMVKQAKIENKFPSYSDIMGASDQYPYGSFYYFNGAFDLYLQQTYGMEKYADFWYRCINWKNFTSRGAFKKAFGIKANQAWKNFMDSVIVPQIPANPVTDGIASDFFNADKSNFSSINNAGSLYSNLTSSEKGTYYLDQKIATISLRKPGSSKSEKVFTWSGINEFKVSRDGRFISFSADSDSSATTKCKIKIYDTENKSFYTLKESSVYAPSIIKSENEYFLVYNKYISPSVNMVISKINLDEKNAICGTSELFTQKLDINSNISSYTDLGNSTFAYIYRHELCYTLFTMKLDGTVISSYKMPLERIETRYLNYSDNKLYFSYATPSTLPRSAYFDLETESFVLSNMDISGGIYYQTADEDKISFTSKYFRQTRILQIDKETLYKDAETIQASKEASPEQTTALELPHESEKAEMTEIPYKKYNPFNFYKRGIFVPVSQISSYTYLPDNSSSIMLPFGVTYASSNPWSTDLIYISAGYGAQTNSAAAQIQWQTGTDTSVFAATIMGQTEFNTSGWKTSDINLSLSSAVPVSKLSYFSASASNMTHFGKPNKNTESMNIFDFESALSSENEVSVYTASYMGLSYSCIHKSGPSKYEKLGISITPLLSYVYSAQLTEGYKEFQNNMNLGLNSKVYIPKLIPVSNSFGFTYNLPSKFKLCIFPSSINSVYDDSSRIPVTPILTDKNRNYLMAGRFETILFGMDIQKAIPFFPLVYANDFRVSVSYTGGLYEQVTKNSSWNFTRIPEYIEMAKTSGLMYQGQTDLKFAIAFTPNIGSAATSSLKTSFYADFSFDSDNMIPCVTSVGIESNF